MIQNINKIFPDLVALSLLVANVIAFYFGVFYFMKKRIFLPMDYTPSKSRLTFIKQIESGCFNGRLIMHRAEYICSCGNLISAYVNNVKTGKTLSCGCLNAETKGALKHGMSNHPLYSVWENMLSRCYNKKVKQYKNYGGRGVVMCEEWRTNPDVFINWGLENGWERRLELDKDILGNGLVYSPQTCCFVTPKINSRNKNNNVFIEFCGERKTLVEWAESLNIHPSGMIYRINKWGIERALITVKQKK